LVSSVDVGNDARGCERLFGIFGFGVCYDDAWFVVRWTGCESDEDIAFDCGWEDTEQGIVDVFTNQAVRGGGIGDDRFSWSRSIECLLDSPRSSRNVGRVSAKTSLEPFRDLDPFPPASERSDQRLRGNGTDRSHLFRPLLRLFEACVQRD
jgi:hypothetical protein